MKAYRRRKIKGVAISDMVSVAVVVMAFLMLAVELAGGFIWNINETTDIYSRYFTMKIDKEVQSLKQGFMKTAAFNAIQDTFGELMTHGNIPERYLKDDELPAGYADGIYPCMKVKTDVDGELIPYWTYPGDDEMLKKIPYIVIKDPHVTFGSAENYITTNENDKITQYVDDVIAGDYDLHLIVHVFMLKIGTFTITGGDGITMSPVGHSGTINYDGTYEYIITDIDPDNKIKAAPITLQFDAVNESGETDRVAYIDYMAFTAYDNDIVNAQNNLFVYNLEKYQMSLEDELDDKNSDDDNLIKMEVSPLNGVYIPSENLRAVVWSEGDGIKAYMDDPFFEESGKKLVEIQSSGLIEEETKLRQKLLTDAGQYLVENMDILKDNIFGAMDRDLDDYHSLSGTTSDSICHSKSESDVKAVCPDDPTPQYAAVDFVGKKTVNPDSKNGVIQSGLDDAEVELNNLYSDKGIEWELVGPDLIKMGCANGYTNDNQDSGSDADECIGSKDKFINDDYGAYLLYMEHRKSSCTAHLCDKIEHLCNGHVDGVEKYYDITCHRTYAHQYILKNIRVLVRIRDTENLYLNTDTKEWEEPVLQFYLTIDKVDDDNCDGHKCSDIHTTVASCPTHG